MILIVICLFHVYDEFKLTIIQLNLMLIISFWTFIFISNRDVFNVDKINRIHFFYYI